MAETPRRGGSADRRASQTTSLGPRRVPGGQAARHSRAGGRQRCAAWDPEALHDSERTKGVAYSVPQGLGADWRLPFAPAREVDPLTPATSPMDAWTCRGEVLVVLDSPGPPAADGRVLDRAQPAAQVARIASQIRVMRR